MCSCLYFIVITANLSSSSTVYSLLFFLPLCIFYFFSLFCVYSLPQLCFFFLLISSQPKSSLSFIGLKEGPRTSSFRYISSILVPFLSIFSFYASSIFSLYFFVFLLSLIQLYFFLFWSPINQNLASLLLASKKDQKLPSFEYLTLILVIHRSLYYISIGCSYPIFATGFKS